MESSGIWREPSPSPLTQRREFRDEHSRYASLTLANPSRAWPQPQPGRAWLSLGLQGVDAFVSNGTVCARRHRWEHGVAFHRTSAPFSERAPVLPESALLRRTFRESESSHRAGIATGGHWGGYGNRKRSAAPSSVLFCVVHSPACAVWLRDACVPPCSFACWVFINFICLLFFILCFFVFKQTPVVSRMRSRSGALGP